MATEIARRLIGKHKSHYYPGADVGDMVIVINAEKVTVTGKKKDQKLYRRHSQRPGSMKIESFRELQARIPERIVEKAVWGMLPKNRLGRELFRHLKVYAGPDHPHAAQQPVEMEWAYKEKALEPDPMRRDFLPGATATTPEQDELARLALLPKESPGKDRSSLGNMSPEEQKVYENVKRILGPEGSPDMMDWIEPRGPHAALAVGGAEIPEMSLTNLKPLKGSWHRRKRKGRGISAGQGKTCGFGDNGQKARSGRSVHYQTRPDGSRVKFAGGSNTRFNAGSLKDHNRGFGPGHKYTKYSLIHLRDLNGLPDGSEVSFSDLINKGMIQKSSKRPLKKIVDGFGLTAKNITIQAHGCTKAARDSIEKNGGKVVLLTKNNKVISEKEQEKKVVAALAIHGWGIECYKVTRKTKPRKKRHLRVRKKVIGSAERPRLCVFRSNNHMYAQIIDDSALDRFGYKSGKILCGASTLSAELKHVHEESYGGNKAAATLVGHLIAEKAKTFGVEKVVFDRAGYKYHGRVAAVADGAREKGLVF
jgi:large subunit ribosomal protein L13